MLNVTANTCICNHVRTQLWKLFLPDNIEIKHDPATPPIHLAHFLAPHPSDSGATNNSPGVPYAPTSPHENNPITCVLPGAELPHYPLAESYQMVVVLWPAGVELHTAMSAGKIHTNAGYGIIIQCSEVMTCHPSPSTQPGPPLRRYMQK